jgi:hypothetical protein
VRRSLLAALLVLLAAAPAAHAAPFQIGVGENPGVAIDAAGTSYVGWQVNPGADGEQVVFCIVPPRARACASTVPLGFPGEGFARSRVSVLLPAPGTVDVVVPRNVGPLRYGAYLVRSVDGGRTFGPAVKLSSARSEQAVLGPAGRVALVGGPQSLFVDSAPADGSAGGSDGAQLGDLLGGQWNDIATQGADVIAASSSTSSTQAFRLSGGADPNQEASWQPLPSLAGREPELAGGPGGLVALLEDPTGRPSATLFVQRLEGAGWAPPVSVFDDLNDGFELSQTARGRLTALRLGFDLDTGDYLEYATSSDGGTFWSSNVRVADYGRANETEIETATVAGGRGVAVTTDFPDGTAVRLVRFTPRTAPVKRRRFRSGRVQVRSVCDNADLTVVVEAKRGNRRVAPSAVLRRARFGRARGARRGFRTRFRARYELTRRRARIPVRVIPRRGKARTLRLRVRRCRATS